MFIVFGIILSLYVVKGHRKSLAFNIYKSLKCVEHVIFRGVLFVGCLNVAAVDKPERVNKP